MKLLCVVVCLFVGSLATSLKEFPDYGNDEYWNDEYLDKLFDNNSGEVLKDDSNKVEEIETKDEAKLENVPAEIANAVVDDYQVEDNRSNEKEQNNGNEVEAQNDLVPVPNEEPMPDDGDMGELPFEKEEPQFDNSFEEIDDALESGFNNENDFKENNEAKDFFDDDSWVDSVEDEEEPAQENNDSIFEETKNILEEDSANGFDDEEPNENDGQEKSENNENMEDNMETIDRNNDENNQNNDEPVKDDDNQPEVANKEIKGVKDSSENGEDTPQKVYADLGADLDKLFATFNKLTDDDDEDDKEEDKEADEKMSVQDYEEKYNRPYKESAILSAREDYNEIADSNLSDIFNENAEEDNVSAEKFDSAEILGADEKIDADIQEKGEKDDENSNVVEKNAGNGDTNAKYGLEYMDGSIEDDSNVDEIKQMFDDQPYGNDGLVAEGQPKDTDAEEIENIEITKEKIESQTKTEKTPESTTTGTARTKMVEDLSSAEFEDLMSQFGIAHQEDFDMKSEDFDKRVAPIHITVSVDKPTVVTSPNYPDRYPTNNVVDWILEGEGRGIELNITDFAVNGALGDYLLVKPGGIDETGHDGLIFSYRLNSERRFRFTDVDRMFVRFEAKPGMQFMTGFRFSVRSILPPLNRMEEIPEPEEVVEPPKYTLTLNLAGLTIQEFTSIQESFKELIADMAARYINEHGIYYGLNSTLEVTQITRKALCSIHLPDYETCVQVTFGVPLNYGDEELSPRLNEEDLEDMWYSLADEDVFAERLNEMGVKEYLLPNDRAVVTVWLVIAAGVVISMAMLGFALWRFSCFDDYTRMRSFGDNDSISNEKRNLDLYPTPHQTLPPLYSESEYKWAEDKYDDSARVDMGGFANKSYMRDDLFEFESDEEVITPRERYATNV